MNSGDDGRAGAADKMDEAGRPGAGNDANDSIGAVYQTINLSVDRRGAAWLELARPDKHNALNEKMIDELHEAAHQLGRDDRVRVVVLAAQGASFCAGGDLGWMRAQMHEDRAARMQQARKLANMLQALDELPKPLIGRVHGPAYGGGIGLMSICDIVVAVESATFVLSETRLGLIPATIAPYVVRRMGEGAARQVFMNSKMFDAAAAARFGLVSTIAPRDELDQLIEREVTAFLNCAPGAVAAAKALCCQMARTPADTHLAATTAQLADRWESEEAQTGIGAFFAKQPPPWQGQGLGQVQEQGQVPQQGKSTKDD